MRGKSLGSVACTLWLVAATVTSLGGLIARPLAIVGAVFVVFALVIAGLEFHPPR